MANTTAQIVWLDTNVVFRYLLNDHNDHAPKAAALVRKAEQGKIKLRLFMVVVMECCDTMIHAMGIDKPSISEAMLRFIALKGIETEAKMVVIEALTRFGQKNNVDFVDAYLAAYAKAKKPAHVVTFNTKDFNVDGLPVSQPDEF